MMFGSSSLRKQLIIWLLLPILVLWVLTGVVIYYVAANFTNRVADDNLEDTARSLVTRVRIESGRLVVDLPPAAVEILETDSRDKFYYQISTDNGSILASNIALPQLNDLKSDVDLREEMVKESPVRMATLRAKVEEGDESKPVLIQVAETLNGRHETIENILLSVGLIQLTSILLGCFVVLFAIRRGLAPLEKLSVALSSRSSRELEPLQVGPVPKEVKPLTSAINDLLVRISGELEVQQRFIANAAHQLRTPLAGLKTQIDLAQRQRSIDDIHPYMSQAGGSIERLTRLIQQLLAMARAEPSGLGREQERVFDLAAISAEVTREFVNQAILKNIDLGFEGKESGITILGRPFSLREMISNLLENALRYTQHGGQVTVRIIEGKNVKLQVEDNGPGIPAEERQRVFERFYRVLRPSNNVDGSGLGLSIVDEIARAHKAIVSIKDGSSGTGTLIEVMFPEQASGR